MSASLPPSIADQYAYRSSKLLGLVKGCPTCEPVESWPRSDTPSRTFAYSPDGRLFASAAPNSVTLVDPSSGSLLHDIPVEGVLELAFSPRGTWLMTWERYVKPTEEGTQTRNLKIWDTASFSEVASFTQKAQDGWALLFAEDESKAVRLGTNDVQIFDPKNFAKGITDKVKVEGVTSISLSPGRNPSVAAFVAEKKGLPASVKVYSLATPSVVSVQKNFFKADKVQMKWNVTGTNLLFMTHTDVDKTGRSYYGETNLYLMSSAGNFDARVSLDKEGPIHDFAWSPNGKDFAVVYGYMPSKTVLFDHRCNVLHDFGTKSRNYVSFNPQARLLCIAGFGNLSGEVDIWDTKTRKKVASFEARNSSACDWNPNGRYLLCPTLSPRLRVDNGVRVFHYSGVLVYQDAITELYQVSWRPDSADRFPFRPTLSPPPPADRPSAAPDTPAPKAAGAYRPPHARGTSTPSIYRREDEGGPAHVNGSSAYPTTNGDGQSPLRRRVPGAPTSAPAQKVEGGDSEGGRRRKKKEAAGEAATAAEVKTAPAPAPQVAQDASALLSTEDKKRRALIKKLTAIDQLKEKKASGETLEKTQLKKIETEGEIRKELAALDLQS